LSLIGGSYVRELAGGAERYAASTTGELPGGKVAPFDA